MRPRKRETTRSGDLFRARLDQIINLKHELAQLADAIGWVARSHAGVRSRLPRSVGRRRLAAAGVRASRHKQGTLAHFIIDIARFFRLATSRLLDRHVS